MESFDTNGFNPENNAAPDQGSREQSPRETESPQQSREGCQRPRSPYESSPYAAQFSGSFPPPKAPKKKAGPWARRIAAGLTVLALIAAGCGITALSVNRRWEARLHDYQVVTDQQLDTLNQQLERISGAADGSSVSGTPVGTPGSLSPAQVYAQNVKSVVAISSTVRNQFGQLGKGSGSGFILSQDGYVITNHHVIEGAEKISVIMSDGAEYEAQLVGKESSNDVAVLKIQASDLPAVTIGSSSDLIIGDMVVAIGNPLGELNSTQTVGYICGKDRDVTTGGSVINMLQTDAAINPGNSGGPLFNMKGEVVGITTAKYSGTTGSGASIEGIGFAIPIDDVTGMVSDLIDFGYVTGAYLGVTVGEMDPEAAAMYNIPVGAYIRDVVEGASADRAGLQAKDIVIRLGRYEVGSITDLTRALRNFKAGETATVTYIRGGAEHTADITFDERPKDLNNPQAETPMPSEGDYDEWFDYFEKFFGDMG